MPGRKTDILWQESCWWLEESVAALIEWTPFWVVVVKKYSLPERVGALLSLVGMDTPGKSKSIPLRLGRLTSFPE